MPQIILCVFALGLFFGPASASEYVNGYTRKDGTYVQPYYRSSPDNSYNNNYEVKPNVNPYSGKEGTLPPTYNDRPPSIRAQLLE
jgi:hypothetical protein